MSGRALLGLALLASAPAFAAERPSLVVLVVVDQLASDYLSRWGEHLDGGVAELRRRGAYYPNGVHAQANTATGPGHASIATGAWPNVHGIVSNAWFDPSTGAEVYCVQDPEYGLSPRNLAVPGIADALALGTSGRGRTVSVAIKDRVAVLTGGGKPRHAIWYDRGTGRFTAGRYGGQVAPEWLERINLERNGTLALGQKWERLRGDLDYAAIAGPDDTPYEADMAGLGKVFPHVYGAGLAGPGAEWFGTNRGTPYTLDTMMRIAKAAIDEEKLGRGSHPDLLVLGMSSLDMIGHWYGPQAQESFDMLLRTDRALGELIAHLDRRLGRGRVLWALTGDHGVTMTPERAAALGVRARRVDLDALTGRVNAALSAAGSKAAVQLIDPPFVFLRHADVDREAARRVAAKVLAASPELAEAHAPADLARMSAPWRQFYERVVFEGRTPDVFIRPHPHDLIEPKGYTTGSGHGSPYTYDTHVPIIIAGPGVRRGEDRRPYDVTRIAPTLAALAGFDPPAAALDPPLPAIGP